MDQSTLLRNVSQIADEFATQRCERQQRRHLDATDFARLHETGFPLVGVPAESGGLWRSVSESTRPICESLRALARGDSSVALVSAMHPAVLSYWLCLCEDASGDEWEGQLAEISGLVKDGCWWGTITSEPGSGGDVMQTRTTAVPTGDSPHSYRITGQKHFGSGSGVMSFMVTTARVEGDEHPDWFFLDMRDVPWDGSQGVQMVAEWDGHGMAATQSHAMSFDNFPATRIAWPGRLPQVASRTGGFIGCLFTSVIVGIVDAAMATARAKIETMEPRPFEQVEWTRAEMDAWLIEQAFEGMIRAAETQIDSRHDVLLGKTAIAELSETLLGRLCKIIGGGTFSRRSPFGFWFEDVRALGFLRPPWGLAFETLRTQ